MFANGSRIDGELSNESLMVSTGSGLLEIAPDEVATLSRDEIQLRDGRVIRGTLVGGQIKARTALGEIAVKVDELQSYRAGAKAAAAGSAPAPAAPAQPAGPAQPDGGRAAPDVHGHLRRPADGSRLPGCAGPPGERQPRAPRRDSPRP